MNTTTTTPIPSIDTKVDYTKLVDEYQPKNWSTLPPNPYYATADGYFELTAAPKIGSNSLDIELNPINCRGRQTYRLKSDESYYKVITFQFLSQP